MFWKISMSNKISLKHWAIRLVLHTIINLVCHTCTLQTRYNIFLNWIQNLYSFHWGRHCCSIVINSSSNRIICTKLILHFKLFLPKRAVEAIACVTNFYNTLIPYDGCISSSGWAMADQNQGQLISDEKEVMYLSMLWIKKKQS